MAFNWVHPIQRLNVKRVVTLIVHGTYYML